MKFTILTSFFLLVAGFAGAQDYIITAELEKATVTGKILDSYDGNLRYVDTQNGDTSEISLQSLLSIRFGETDEVRFIRSIKKQYIPCYIESIGLHYIRYRDFESGEIKNLNKDFMFACQFNDSCTNAQLNAYFSLYSKKVLNQIFPDKVTIIKKSSIIIDAGKISFKEAKVCFSIIKNENMVETFLNRNEVKEIYFTTEKQRICLNHGSELILSREGKAQRNYIVGEISSQHIELINEDSHNQKTYRAGKGEICAILFYDYEAEK